LTNVTKLEYYKDKTHLMTKIYLDNRER